MLVASREDRQDRRERSQSGSCGPLPSCGWFPSFSYMFSSKKSSTQKSIAPPSLAETPENSVVIDDGTQAPTGIFSRPGTPERVRSPRSRGGSATGRGRGDSQLGATEAYIVGKLALQNENETFAAQQIQAGCRGHLTRIKSGAKLAGCEQLQGLARGSLARRGVAALGGAMWGSDEDILLAILQYMAVEEDIYKVLYDQLDCQADYLFPERKARGAQSLRLVLPSLLSQGLVTSGGRAPKCWVSLASGVDTEALPIAPRPVNDNREQEEIVI